MAVLIGREGFRKGFTLIELIVVIALLSLLISISLPNSGFVTSINERLELRMMVKDLRQARNRAILENRLVRASFYVDSNKYVIRYSEGDNIKVKELSSGLRILHAGSVDYNFNNDGRVGNSDSITLKNSKNKLYRISIAPNTTEITLREVD